MANAGNVLPPMPSLSTAIAFVKNRGRKSLEFTTLIKAIGVCALRAVRACLARAMGQQP